MASKKGKAAGRKLFSEDVRSRLERKLLETIKAEKVKLSKDVGGQQAGTPFLDGFLKGS